MSAAHELVERGFDVQVFELHPIPGGKARSLAVPLRQSFTNVGSVHLPRLSGARRKHLPGEHGFRFFPRFYKHVIDTMSRIPYGRYGSVADNLVDTTTVQLARFGRRPLLLPARFPHSLEDLRIVLDDFLAVFTSETGIPFEEKTFFAERVWQILTSCDERRLAEYEKVAWWDFVEAEARSASYQKLLASGITRSLVASKARVASTKTIGDIFVQLLFNIAEPGISSDRVLNGPTNEVWIDPWLTYLQERGVDYWLNSRVTRIDVAGGRVVSAHVQRGATPLEVQADYYVAAVPVEVMASLVDDGMLLADPSLANLKPLSQNVEWMNGVQLYLSSDVPMNHGHVLYVDSPWALTSISQMQFWPSLDLSQYGTGKARGIISIDISDWGAPGLNGKAARDCSADEIRDEVWEQLKRSVNIGPEPLLRDDMLVDWFVDSDIDVVARANSEPLLVNLVNSWPLRPDATTRIPNLFLASDYVRTYTDLATMEAANEAARRAVNGVLDAAESGAQRCTIWKLHDPEFLEPWRALDRSRFQQGLPWSDIPGKHRHRRGQRGRARRGRTPAAGGDDDRHRSGARTATPAARRAVGAPRRAGPADHGPGLADGAVVGARLARVPGGGVERIAHARLRHRPRYDRYRRDPRCQHGGGVELSCGPGAGRCTDARG